MEWMTLLLLALSLSMDAFAVSISDGVCMEKMTLRRASFIAATFGAFQALMPLIGFYLGAAFSSFIEAVDHWIAFGLLALIGANMIREAIAEAKQGEGDACDARGGFSVKLILAQGIATSIDALAVGVSLALTGANIAVSAPVIGAVTFLVCLPAVLAGRRIGSALSHRAQVVGGAVLVCLGLKILAEHLLG